MRLERDRISQELRDVKSALAQIKDAVFTSGTPEQQLAAVRKVLGGNLQHAVSSGGRWYDLVRYFDSGGQSGTGRVGEVAEFDDGTAVLRWLSETPSTVIYESIDHVSRIHGHGGATEMVPR
jgi:hypothetical protein